MIIEYEYGELLKRRDSLIFIDVRSPVEYKKEHIPGAVNIPVFSDEEREKIGIIYKNEGKRSASEEALKIVGPKLYDIYLKFEENSRKGFKMVVYCARGGMRSSTVSSLFKELSLPTLKLSKGYKGYRNYINEKLPELIAPLRFVVLYGKTGSGKTKILKILKEKGHDVLDLEKYANHRGSLLGSIGLGEQNSQKYFESLLFEEVLSLKNRTVFIEGESQRVGKIFLPQYLYAKIKKSEKIYIETGIEKRIEIIKEEYLKEGYDSREVVEAVKKLSRYIGAERTGELVRGIEKGSYDAVIGDLIENYYDKVYKTKNEMTQRVFYNIDEEKCASEIAEYI